MVIAVILSLTRLKHPKWEAKSPITAVSTPIQQMDEKNAGQPFKYSFICYVKISQAKSNLRYRKERHVSRKTFWAKIFTRFY